MKKLIWLLFLFPFWNPCFSQNDFELSRQRYPSDLTKFIPIKIMDIKNISEELIINNLPETYPFLDSVEANKLKCIALHKFTMSFYRKGEKGILDLPSDENRMSFGMKLILKNSQVGDIILFDYIECVISNYDYKRREGVFFKVVE